MFIFSFIIQIHKIKQEPNRSILFIVGRTMRGFYAEIGSVRSFTHRQNVAESNKFCVEISARSLNENQVV